MKTVFFVIATVGGGQLYYQEHSDHWFPSVDDATIYTSYGDAETAIEDVIDTPGIYGIEKRFIKEEENGTRS